MRVEEAGTIDFPFGFNFLSSGWTISMGTPSSPGVTMHGTTWPMTRPRSISATSGRECRMLNAECRMRTRSDISAFCILHSAFLSSGLPVELEQRRGVEARRRGNVALQHVVRRGDDAV